MCTTGDNGEIIILSDDDEDEDDDVLCIEPSVLIVEVEEQKKNEVVLPQESLDEDLVVTFSRRAEVLPHARYDCPIHAFTATECETTEPVDKNQLFCDQCFCYICDKLASSCAMWSCKEKFHCNSHKKSNFWTNIRNDVLLGGLKHFNLTLSEVDNHLRQADLMLQNFEQELSELFSNFVKGTALQEQGQNLPKQQAVTHDYTPVYEFVSSFLTEADKQESRAAAIMRVGAAKKFIRHFHPSGSFLLQSPFANAVRGKTMLLQRVIESVQRQIVRFEFSLEFAHKVQDYYKASYFPANLKSMKNSLCVRPWNDVLLMSVLKGQNVTGVRKDKGKKDILIEQMYVVLLRAELLQNQHRYRELCRYLRVVQADDPELLQQLQDLIPFYKCKDGDLMSAMQSLFPSVNAPVTRFTPFLFLLYLRIFETATAPKLTVSQPVQLCCSDAMWEPIRDAVPLKRIELVKFALRCQRLCSAVYIDSQCWTRLLSVVNTPAALTPPIPQFLHEARVAVNSLLRNLDGGNVQIPRLLQEVYPDQSLLLLVTGALCWRILTGGLNPAISVLNTFENNMWAVEWLWDGLGLRLKSFLLEITQEIEEKTGRPAVEFFSSQVKAMSLNYLLM